MTTTGDATLVTGSPQSPQAAAPAGVPQEFTDPAFKARRTQNWVVLGLLYAFFYMSRYNFAAIMSQLSKTFGWTNTQLGVFETFMPLIYGLSVLFNGPIADRIGGRKSFLFGAMGVVVMNFLSGPASWRCRSRGDGGAGHAAHVVTPAILRYGWLPRSLLTIMALIWGINGYFQSFGALRSSRSTPTGFTCASVGRLPESSAF